MLLSGELDGLPLRWLNYVLVDSQGALWCSVSTATDDLLDTLSRGTADGYILRVAPDRSAAAVVARGVQFPNCMAIDHDENYLYVARTLATDAVRFPIVGTTWGNRNISAPRWGAAGRRIRRACGNAPRQRRDGSPMGNGGWLRSGRAWKPLGHNSCREQDRGDHAPGGSHGRGRGCRRDFAELADKRRVGWCRHARCLHRFDRSALRPQRPQFSAGNADGPSAVTRNFAPTESCQPYFRQLPASMGSGTPVM